MAGGNHSPTMGMCPARHNGSANASIAFTFAGIFSGSSPVPERCGPAMRIIRDVIGRRRWNVVELSGVRSKPDARGRCREVYVSTVYLTYLYQQVDVRSSRWPRSSGDSQMRERGAKESELFAE